MPKVCRWMALLWICTALPLGAEPAAPFRDLSFPGELALLDLAAAPSDPARLYALAREGFLLRSDDGGRSFAAILPAPAVFSETSTLLVDPHDADGVFLVTADGSGVSQSADGGRSWKALELPAGAAGFWLEAREPGRWYSARQSRLFRHEPGDGWIPLAEIAPGDADAVISSLAIDGLDSGHLLAGLGRGFGARPSGIYESRDGGASWALRQSSFEFPHLAFDPFDPSRAWAVSFDGGDSALWRSLDGGATWTQALPGSALSLKLAFDPARPGHLVVASHFRHSPSQEFLLTRNHGESWERLELPFGNSQDYALHLLGDGRWVVTSRDPDAATFTESSDLLASWRSLQNMPARLVELALDPHESEHAWAVTATGVYRSTRGGASWVPVFAADVPFARARLAIDPEDSRFLLLAHSRLSAGPFLWRSSDRGRTWHEALRSAGAIYLGSLAAGRREGRPFAVASFETESFEDVIFRSGDLGESWQSFPGEEAHVSAVDPAAGALFRLAGPRVERSLDGGLHFAAVADFSATGLVPTSLVAGGGHRLFALASANLFSGPSRLFEIFPGQAPNERFLPASDCFVLPGLLAAGRRPGELYFTPNCGNAGNPLWASDDAGRSWIPAPAGLPQGILATLVASPADGSLWVAPSAFGVFRGRADFNEETLRLRQDRFAVRATFRDGAGRAFPGKPRVLTGETGYFALAEGERIEAVVKILDGRPLTGSFWLFGASLTRLGLELEVFDRQTGETRNFVHLPGSLASFADFGALAAPPPLADRSAAAAPAAAALAGGRFEVAVAWRDFDGVFSGTGQPLRLASDDTAAFHFFLPSNLEAFVRIVDGRQTNGHFGVVVAGLSNLDYTVTVRDLATGHSWEWHNPPGTFASVEVLAALPGE